MKIKRVRSPVSMELPPRPVARSPPRLELGFSLCCSGYRAAAASPATINRLDARGHRGGTRRLERRRTRALRGSRLATHFRFSLLPSQPPPLAPSAFPKPLAGEVVLPARGLGEAEVARGRWVPGLRFPELACPPGDGLKPRAYFAAPRWRAA